MNIFSYVAQQERQLSGINSLSNLSLESKENVSINAAKVTCEFCGRVGHTESVCYKKHRVPTSYEGRSKTYSRNMKTCTHCGKIGHTIDVCYKKHGYPPGYKFGNIKVVNNIMEGKAVNDQMQRQESHDLVHFTPEQYQALLALIQQPSSGSSVPTQPQVASISSCPTNTSPGIILSLKTTKSSSWILNSEATDHVSFSLTNFDSYNQINPILVKLPNRHEVHATHSGTVHLTSSITLKDVLYIPSFSFNLISISKLISTNNYELIFSSNTCVLQDINTKAKIGTVEVSHGLYQLTLKPSHSRTICSTITHPKCNVIPIDLWHFHMGHPSIERLQVMKAYYPSLHNNNKNFVCNTCHYAKHKRSPFPSSISHAFSIFDLIHIDIWGPCSKISMHGHRYFLTIVDDHSRFT